MARTSANQIASSCGSDIQYGQAEKTLLEAAQRAKRIATDINAVDFAVYLVGETADRGRLTPCLDNEFPEFAPTTKLLAVRSGEVLARHVLVSSVPMWWSSSPGTVSARNFQQLFWPAETEACLPGTSGLVFPVYGERGQAGLVAFLGGSIKVDERSLCETHARCFSLFDLIAGQKALAPGSAPLVSKREIECLRLAANGQTSEDIARLLGLSVHTANQYLANATHKLNAVNRMHAVAKALRYGLIE